MPSRENHLTALENESIHIVREAVAQAERPALLFSGGKDSAVILRLAVKAFHPAPLPFPLLHVDTGHNFPEVIAYRDQIVRELGAELLVASVQEAIDEGRVGEETGPRASRNQLQTESLLHAVRKHQLDVLMGGARRDEEKARAKERVFSFRDEFGQWDPKQQRPELWSLYFAQHRAGEQVRVFPISNWTELDVYQYVARENIPLPTIYFAHRRRVFARDGMLMADSPFLQRFPTEMPFDATVRFRTVGDMTCTGAFESTASTIGEIMLEVAQSRVTERGASRADDKVAETAMEDRKREGYF
ncbi:MAG: sulfate adenylyltransferase subunit CysD [Deltaproteobacteria bacterium]|jgi:sulfate adenylyltransferase subunit 2|nr:sulfate adenylyltransferase subunit CysD [Deltaproteobacteria bacterium]